MSTDQSNANQVQFRLPCALAAEEPHSVLFADETVGHKFDEPTLVRALKESAVTCKEVVLEIPLAGGQALTMIGQVKSLKQSGKAVIVDFAILRPAADQPGLSGSSTCVFH